MDIIIHLLFRACEGIFPIQFARDIWPDISAVSLYQQSELTITDSEISRARYLLLYPRVKIPQSSAVFPCPFPQRQLIQIE